MDNLTSFDIRAVIFLKLLSEKNHKFKFFVASKKGGNSRGRGVNRAVILGSDDGKSWHQVYKVWGKNNLARAYEIVRQANIK